MNEPTSIWQVLPPVCGNIALLFVAGFVVWVAWYLIHTNSDRQNNKRVDQYRKEFANMVREHGYATDEQVQAAMEAENVESDEGDGDAVLMQNLTKKRRWYGRT